MNYYCQSLSLTTTAPQTSSIFYFIGINSTFTFRYFSFVVQWSSGCCLQDLLCDVPVFGVKSVVDGIRDGIVYFCVSFLPSWALSWFFLWLLPFVDLIVKNFSEIELFILLEFVCLLAVMLHKFKILFVVHNLVFIPWFYVLFFFFHVSFVLSFNILLMFQSLIIELNI